MEWRIERDSENPAVVFAAEELASHLKRIDISLEIAILKSGALLNGTIKLFTTNNSELDDAYEINIKNGVGKIEGTNPRAVLLGVYRFLYELGCRWLKPGRGGEKIPQKSLRSCAVKISDAASYRHRGVCIEGSCSFSHVSDMIEWLPKVGMNAYFNQFSTPYCFFDYWYKKNQPATFEEVTAMVSVLTEQIKKRGLMYHATGHGWTCDPIGIKGNGWAVEEFTLTDEQRSLLAQVNGKREVFGGIALNTNLCYSNPAVREKIVNAITSYCREHCEVDYLHFWLADVDNNHCECENCKDTLPSDFYVQMLNETDECLGNIPTKIVFLVYFDLLWEPAHARLKNTDRFTLMFAPITRTYTKAFCEGDVEIPTELAPYKRNKLEMPKTVGENIARLKRWQEQFRGDSFDFDYHLIWDHYHDPGEYESARILFEDMKNLDRLNLNGMVSCQVQRAFFPTGFAMNAMAAALWNKNLTFESFAKTFFTDLFGKHANEMQHYFKKLSTLFQPAYLRGELPHVSKESAKLFAKIPSVINKMLPKLISRREDILIIHAQLCLQSAETLRLKAEGKQSEAEDRWSQTKDYVNQMEPVIHNALDIKYFTDVIGRSIRGERMFG